MRSRQAQLAADRAARLRALLAAALALACGCDAPPPALPELPAAEAAWSLADARRAAAVVQQIAATDASALPRLAQRESSPAVARLFELPSRTFLDGCLEANGAGYALLCSDPTVQLLAVYAAARERQPDLVQELLFVATEAVATQTSLLVEWERDTRSLAADAARLESMEPPAGYTQEQLREMAARWRAQDAQSRRAGDALKASIERIAAGCLAWLAEPGLEEASKRQLLRRLVWALGPGLASPVGLLENAESCAAIRAARSAARDGETRKQLDALARGGRCG